MTKATVSRRITALEESLATELVVRGAEGMTVTNAGLATVRVAEAMEASAAHLRDGIASATDAQVEGVVKFTLAPWLSERLFIPAVSRLREAFPKLDLRVVSSHDVVDVAAHDADLALRNVRPSAGALVCCRVGELAGCIYGSRLYLERRGVPKDRADLHHHDLLIYDGIKGMPGFEWMAEPEWQPRSVFRASDPAGLASAAASGLGLAAIPCILGETEPALRRLDVLGVGYSPLYLVTREELQHAPRGRAVWQLVAEVLRENEAILMGRGQPDGG